MTPDELKKRLFEERRCGFCDSQEFLEGPHGGMSVNIMCASCGARFNICPPFSAEVIGQPTIPAGILLVRDEKELSVVDRVVNWARSSFGQST